MKIHKAAQVRSCLDAICHYEPFPFGNMEAEGRIIHPDAIFVRGEINDLLFSFSVTQAYENRADQATYFYYGFPLGPYTHFLGAQIETEGRKLKGLVFEKAKADFDYDVCYPSSLKRLE